MRDNLAKAYGVEQIVADSPNPDSAFYVARVGAADAAVT